MRRVHCRKAVRHKGLQVAGCCQKAVNPIVTPGPVVALWTRISTPDRSHLVARQAVPNLAYQKQRPAQHRKSNGSKQFKHRPMQRFEPTKKAVILLFLSRGIHNHSAHYTWLNENQ